VSADLTGGLRFWNCGLGDREVNGGKIEGVGEPVVPLDVDGLGGECFVGEIPLAAGIADACPISCWGCTCAGGDDPGGRILVFEGCPPGVKFLAW